MAKNWIEPTSKADTNNPPLYPYNNATISESGHSFELDDTPNRERVRLFHRNGSFIEFHPNGDVQLRTRGNNYTVVLTDNNVLVKGDYNLQVDGDFSHHVKGNYNLQVDGDYTKSIKGDVQYLSTDSSKEDDRMTNGDLNLSATGNIILSAKKVLINAETNVNGDLSCSQTITAQGNINAYKNVTGYMSLRTLGGLLVGPTSALMPTASPGSGLFDTDLTAYVSMTTFGEMTCMDGFFMGSGCLFNSHLHISNEPGLPTSTPIL